MSRIRTVKPALFKHEALFDAERETGLPLRVAFIGLFCCCDREGRFKWHPRTLKSDLLPFDEVDFSRVLDALMTRGFIFRYTSKGDEFGVIPTFKHHQAINNRESPSELPAPPDSLAPAGDDASGARERRVIKAPLQRISGRGKGKERSKPKIKNIRASRFALRRAGAPRISWRRTANRE
ncbi:hypothetical protein R75461_07758 [Paraburkholderia nemoris]|uniref:hypothetical protein n=1 Tax=Paraburkholderia nemoris TaxID=2793076 RepID=UPI00190CBEEB|nr:MULTISPECIES: hypothetical protein [Paraburkholderia]MBK3786543.1 hypothetical protein [Paraburkholderia aspalathi]CAE6856846.1 hypothetical protein R75461_07758 [Paraburkholderia nemoris]